MKRILFLFLITVFVGLLNAQDRRTVSILDMTERNEESNSSNLYSAEYILKTAGIPYKITADLVEAVKYPVLLLSSGINSDSFSNNEQIILDEYVYSGGILIVPQLLTSKFYNMFGISNDSISRRYHKIRWNVNKDKTLFRWINDSLEQTIRIGADYYDETINTAVYTLDKAEALAFYDDGAVGACRNIYGKGFTYLLGVSFKFSILFNQLNFDYESQRTYIDGFEPGLDVYIMLLKGIYSRHIPFAAWKHSAPFDMSSVLVFTHDVDYGGATDVMLYFADFEKKNNVKGTYFVTTHYISDDRSGDYYTPNVQKIKNLIGKGMDIGSHSVGHFSGFIELAKGAPGNTKDNYKPYQLNDTIINGKTYQDTTFNASVYGECEVSKYLLEKECGADVKAWRSGHLIDNDYLGEVLAELGYKYSSTESANDVLTHFPYPIHKNLSFSGEVLPVLEIPVTFDTDPFEEADIDSVSSELLNVFDKIDDNNAVAVVLTHPTDNYKIKLFETLLLKKPLKMYPMSLTDYGDYWNMRDKFYFYSELSADSVLTISIPEAFFPLDPQISLLLNNGFRLKNIIVRKQNGAELPFYKVRYTWDDVIIYFGQPTGNIRDEYLKTDIAAIYNFPNPFNEKTDIRFFLNKPTDISLDVYDFQGRLIKQLFKGQLNFGMHSFTFDAALVNAGIYFYKLNTSIQSLTGKMILLK
ncbi:MAG: T9SS type A sorting domain-containing protein [Bacteroidales bacterium]|nr:T9SS type A sorting domain-containing protein [Bacteroidales bacterium]